MSEAEEGSAGPLRAFLRASSADRRLFLRAAILLPCLRLALAAFGFRRLTSQLKRLSAKRLAAKQLQPSESSRSEQATLKLFSRAVERATRFSPGKATCLERSLLLWWMLRRAGVACELRVGVRRDEGELFAHAWLEHGGRPINDHPEIAATYAPFEAPLA